MAQVKLAAFDLYLWP